MAKIQPKEHADFVITMIDRDLSVISDNDGRLDYLRDIGNYIDEVGEKILRTNDLGEGPTTIGRDIKTTIGEDRPETDFNDMDLSVLTALKNAFPDADVINMSDDYFDPHFDLLAALFEASRPPGETALNPIEFLRRAKCLKGDRAADWLQHRKYPRIYPHIHVFEGDRCLVLPGKDDVNEVHWINQDGVICEGHPFKVLKYMFFEYVDNHNG